MQSDAPAGVAEQPPDKRRKWLARREFAREVGSIVLGVLIALGIGEIADQTRWKVRVHNSMAAMREELAGNRFNLVDRRLYEGCLEKRLAALGQLLNKARETGRLRQVRNIGRPGSRLFEYTAFEVSKSEGVPLHMDRDQARKLAKLYENFSIYQTLAADEAASWRTLKLMEHSGGPVSSDLLVALLQAWSNASEQLDWLKIVTQQGDQRLGEFGIKTEFGTSHDLANLKKRNQARPVCQPLLVDGTQFYP